MSAFMCDDDTFDYLAGLMRTCQPRYDAGFTFYLPEADRAALVDAGVLDTPIVRLDGRTDTAALITILRRENLTSLVARYGEKALGDAGEYTLRPVPSAEVDPVVALKSLACLDYQSCEHEGYERSVGKRLIGALTDYAVSLLPGYEAAPWGWTRADAATAAKAAAAPTAAADWNF
jgi:hypothetical protein